MPLTPPINRWNTVNVGGGLPPMAECQSTTTWLTRRHRGQAPSHRGYAVSVRMGFIGDLPAYSHSPTPPAPTCCHSRSSASNCGYMTKCHLPRRSIGGIRSMWEGACPLPHFFARGQAVVFVGLRHSMERSTVVLAISSKCHTARIFARSGFSSSSPQSSAVAEALSSRLAV